MFDVFLSFIHLLGGWSSFAFQLLQRLSVKTDKLLTKNPYVFENYMFNPIEHWVVRVFEFYRVIRGGLLMLGRVGVRWSMGKLG